MTTGEQSAEAPSSMSSSLLELVKGHDREAWRKLVRLYGPLIYYWCAQAGLHSADSADVTQEVFRAVAVSIGGFERHREGGTFRGWLRTTTRSKLSDFFRRRQQQSLPVGGSTYQNFLASLPASGESRDSASNDVSPPEQTLLVRRVLELVRSEVEPRTWQAFWRTAIESEPTRDVAAALGMTPTAVRIAKSRVLRKLRQLLLYGDSPP